MVILLVAIVSLEKQTAKAPGQYRNAANSKKNKRPPPLPPYLDPS